MSCSVEAVKYFPVEEHGIHDGKKLNMSLYICTL